MDRNKVFIDNNKTYFFKREGTKEDPYVDINEEIKIQGSRAILREVPDKYSKVVATDEDLEWIETYKHITKPEEFYVDYVTGIVYFHSARNGLNPKLTYKGTGMLSFPISRIWTDHDGEKPVQTLKDLVDYLQTSINSGKSTLEELELMKKAKIESDNRLELLIKEVESLREEIKELKNTENERGE